MVSPVRSSTRESESSGSGRRPSGLPGHAIASTLPSERRTNAVCGPAAEHPDPGADGRQPHRRVGHGERALLARGQGQERPVHRRQDGARRAVDLGHGAHDSPGHADAARGRDAAALGQGADVADRESPPAAVERNEIVEAAETAGHRLAAYTARRELKARDTARDFCPRHHELRAFIQSFQFPPPYPDALHRTPGQAGSGPLNRESIIMRCTSAIYFTR